MYVNLMNMLHQSKSKLILHVFCCENPRSMQKIVESKFEEALNVQ